MYLGTFSISLAVKDLEASRAFCEKFGFTAFAEDASQKLARFTDIRELQRQLRAQGVQLEQQADESTTGPASLVAVDPDGNQSLLDQHV